MKPIMDYVNECEANCKQVNLSSEAAAQCGFVLVAKKSRAVEKGYIMIKPERIVEYLRQLVLTDVKCGEKLEDFRSRGEKDNIWVQGELKYRYWGEHRWWTSSFTWVETPVGEYSEIPPAIVYQKLLVAKKNECFDYFTVATIEKNERLKDPLLIGRIENDDNRYFIAQWDDDIQLDNLV